MPRYIDAEKLKHLVNEKNYNAINKHFFFDCIIECDTEDVAPVVRAKWEVCGTFDDFLKCSNCDWDAPMSTVYDWKIKYCPHCGAKMDEAVTSEETNDGTI